MPMVTTIEAAIENLRDRLNLCQPARPNAIGSRVNWDTGVMAARRCLGI